MKPVGLPEALAKLPGILVELSETPVRLSGIQVKLPGTHIKLTETPAVNLLGTPDKLPRSPVKLSGTQNMLPAASVKQQVIIPEPIVQTEQQQTFTSNHQPLNSFDKNESKMGSVQHPANKDCFLED